MRVPGDRRRMLNYTEQLWRLMHDVASRVPKLSFIDTQELFVFARHGRAGADGAFATCHSLTLPESEPGYYFWRDRSTGSLTRRSEWFVTKTPEVRIDGNRIKYLISFVLPRFCEQSLSRSRKAEFYGAEIAPWVAKLDTVIHELYHIDPEAEGLRKFIAADGARVERSHGPGFYEQVAEMVQLYLATSPDPRRYEFLKYDFNGLRATVRWCARPFETSPRTRSATLNPSPSSRPKRWWRTCPWSRSAAARSRRCIPNRTWRSASSRAAARAASPGRCRKSAPRKIGVKSRPDPPTLRFARIFVTLWLPASSQPLSPCRWSSLPPAAATDRRVHPAPRRACPPSALRPEPRWVGRA
jgi:hypothetical protein